jgi:hypothetical protein
MSQRDVEQAIGRLVTDEEFRRDFYRDPPHACVGLGIQLTKEELEAVMATPRSALADLASRLDDRVRRLNLLRLVPRMKGAQGT